MNKKELLEKKIEILSQLNFEEDNIEELFRSIEETEVVDKDTQNEEVEEGKKSAKTFAP